MSCCNYYGYCNPCGYSYPCGYNYACCNRAFLTLDNPSSTQITGSTTILSSSNLTLSFTNPTNGWCVSGSYTLPLTAGNQSITTSSGIISFQYSGRCRPRSFTTRMSVSGTNTEYGTFTGSDQIYRKFTGNSTEKR